MQYVITKLQFLMSYSLSSHKTPKVTCVINYIRINFICTYFCLRCLHIDFTIKFSSIFIGKNKFFYWLVYKVFFSVINLLTACMQLSKHPYNKVIEHQTWKTVFFHQDFFQLSYIFSKTLLTLQLPDWFS